MPGPLLVVTIDRLPAWILSAYGATWVATPALARLAARGVVFDGFVATSDEPAEAVRSLLAWTRALAPATLAVVTDDAALADGITSAAVTVVPPASPPRPADDESQADLARLFAAAAAVVAQRQHNVVWCHASSLGTTWDAPDEFRRAYVDPDDPPPPAGAAVPDLLVTSDSDPDLVAGLRHVFAGQITLLDRCLARLVAAAGDRCTILVAGVRGMPLGLHGRLGPGPLPPYAELVRLPAILVDAGGRMAGQRHDGLVTAADLGATLAEMVTGGVGALPPESEPWQGRSLAPLFADWTLTPRDRVIVSGSAGVAVATSAWHLVRLSHDGEPVVRLFARPDDYFDLCDVANRCPSVVDDLRPLADAAAAGDRSGAWTRPLGAGAHPAT
jgi:arylsulfatase A-like enzyme